MPPNRRLVAEMDASTANYVVGRTGIDRLKHRPSRKTDGAEGALNEDLIDIYFSLPKHSIIRVRPGRYCRRDDNTQARSLASLYINFLTDKIHPYSLPDGSTYHVLTDISVITGTSPYLDYLQTESRRGVLAASSIKDYMSAARNVNDTFQIHWGSVLVALMNRGNSPINRTVHIENNRRIKQQETVATATENHIDSMVTASLRAAQNNTQEG